MTDYFVRVNGSDSNAGTSAGAAWRSLSKALGASGMSSGDTLWVGPGFHRQAAYTPIEMTSPTVETFIRGDVTGANTGDEPGEVSIVASRDGWNGPSNVGDLDINGRDFLTFEDLAFYGRWAITENAGGSTNVTFRRCYFHGILDGALMTANFNVPMHWLYDRCILWGGADGFIVTAKTSTAGVADYDLDLVFQDSILIGGNTRAAQMAVDTGAGTTWKPGGVDFLRCTMIGLLNVSTNYSTTIPCTIQDCLIFGNVAAATAGQISDLGGNIWQADNINVTPGASTRLMTDQFNPLSLGHEWLWGMEPRKAFSPIFPSANFGTIGSSSTDMAGRPSPEGGGAYLDSGTATAGAATTLTDSGKAWSVDQHRGKLVRITGGTGADQIKHINSNTATVLTIGTKSGDWATTPDATSTYVIYDGTPAETGKATSGSDTTIVDSGAAWTTNQWAGFTVAIGAESKTVISNTSTTITTASWTTDPTTNDLYSIYKGSLTEQGRYPGALQRHDTMQQETSVVDAGGSGGRLEGKSSQEFQIPVDATSTTISIRARYDANHGTTNKPQAVLVANDEIGVTTETVTMTAAADTWETLAFAAQTPAAVGVVTVRLVSRSDAPYGRAYFDSWTIA